MQLHYVEIYPGRRWMEDRLHFATLHRWAEYADSEYNERSALFDELWQLLPGLSDTQFKWLMRHDREEPRFICHSCAKDGLPGHDEPYADDVPTAYRVGETMEALCVMCGKTRALKQGKCSSENCGCELLSADPDSDGSCMKCGWSERDEERSIEFEREMAAASPRGAKLRLVPVPDASREKPE